MSCMAINLQSLVNVRDAVKKEFPTVHVDVDKFFYSAFIFNAVEYFNGKYATEHESDEPVEWAEFKHLYEVRESQPITLEQLYKSLCFIDYNTEPRGWMTYEQYQRWHRKDEYEAFKKSIVLVTSMVAYKIIMQTSNYKDAKWG